MKNKTMMACLGLAVGFIAGCGQKDQDAQRVISEKVSAQEKEIEVLKEQISKIYFDLLMLKNDNSKSGEFDITAKGYSKIDHNNGFFLVSLVDVQAKGDGQELTFNFGNPLATQFAGAQMKVAWWPRTKLTAKQPGYFKERVEVQKERQEREVKITETIRQGSWNKVKIIIAPAPAEKAGIIEISEIVTDQVFLSR